MPSPGSTRSMPAMRRRADGRGQRVHPEIEIEAHLVPELGLDIAIAAREEPMVS